MNTSVDQIQINDVSVNVIRKDIKNIHLAVYPPCGRIRLAAPLKTSDETIRMLILSRTLWIKKQQLKFNNQERQGKREYVSGESHYLWGKRYRLNVRNTDATPKVEIKRPTFIDLYITPESNIRHREEVLDRFYRNELQKNLVSLAVKWKNITKISVNEFRIKKMKTRWGTCNENEKRIWLNLELAKKPVHCLEYVLLHEIIHITEKKHSDRFTTEMNKYMPQWQQYKSELNQFPLSHSDWAY